jgi:RPA family protein
MTRDVLGHRIKKTVTPYEQFFMEKFYIHNNKVYQIIRVEVVCKIGADLVEFITRSVKTNKIRKFTIIKEAFESRKYYYSKRKALLANLYKGLLK